MTKPDKVPLPIGEELGSVYKMLDERVNKYRASGGKDFLLGQTTGLTELDKQTLGLCGGDLIIIAGRPGMGKTALAYNISDSIAASGAHVVYFSLEMLRRALAMRHLSSKSGVPMRDIQIGAMKDDEYQRVIAAGRELYSLPLYVGDDVRRLGEVVAISRYMKSLDQLDAVFFDYLQLANTERGGYSRENDVAAMSRILKELAMELDVPIICLSQLNRVVEQRIPPRPALSDLRESGAIEQDADMVLLLYRRKPYMDRKDDDGKQEFATRSKMTIAQCEAQCEVIIAKQRNGPTGIVKTWFEDETQKFHDWERFYG